MLGIDDLRGPEAAEPSLAVHPAADCWCVPHAAVHPPLMRRIVARCVLYAQAVGGAGQPMLRGAQSEASAAWHAASRMLHAGCRAAWRGLHVACVMLQPVVLQCSCALYRAWLVLHVAFSAPMCRIRPCCIRPCCIRPCCIRPCCIRPCCIRPCCICPCCIRPCCIGYATLCARCAGRAVWRSVCAITRL